MKEFLDKLNILAAEYSTRALGALVILIVGIWAARKLTQIVAELLSKTHLDGTLQVFASHITRILLYVLVFLAALNSIGVPLTSVMALLGTIGLAVALALKDSLNNVAAGLSLLILRPFRVGDYIEIGSTGGTVMELSFYHTVLNTADNRRVIIPNSKAISDVITNFSLNPTRRIDMVFEASYNADLKQVQQLLKDLIAQDERILKEPEAVVAVSNLASDAVQFVVRPWVNQADYWPVRFDYTEKVKLSFDAAGIEIPYAQRDLHLRTQGQVLKVQVLAEPAQQELPLNELPKKAQKDA